MHLQVAASLAQLFALRLGLRGLSYLPDLLVDFCDLVLLDFGGAHRHRAF
jgi:hypothetical protein